MVASWAFSAAGLFNDNIVAPCWAPSTIVWPCWSYVVLGHVDLLILLANQCSPQAELQGFRVKCSHLEVLLGSRWVCAGCQNPSKKIDLQKAFQLAEGKREITSAPYLAKLLIQKWMWWFLRSRSKTFVFLLVLVGVLLQKSAKHGYSETSGLCKTWFLYRRRPALQRAAKVTNHPAYILSSKLTRLCLWHSQKLHFLVGFHVWWYFFGWLLVSGSWFFLLSLKLQLSMYPVSWTLPW